MDQPAVKDEGAPDVVAQFEAAYRAHYAGALGFARRMRSPDPEDVVHAVFMTLWAHYSATPPRFLPVNPKKARSYILTAVKNRIASSDRSASVLEEKSGAIGHDVDVTPRVWMNPEDAQLRDERIRIVTMAIESLPQRCREAFELVRIDGLGYAAAAEVQGVSVSTIHQQVVKANSLLTAFLSKYDVPGLLSA